MSRNATILAIIGVLALIGIRYGAYLEQKQASTIKRIVIVYPP